MAAAIACELCELPHRHDAGATNSQPNEVLYAEVILVAQNWIGNVISLYSLKSCRRVSSTADTPPSVRQKSAHICVAVEDCEGVSMTTRAQELMADATR